MTTARFILRQAWDPGARVKPYLAAIEAALDAVVARPGRGRPRARGGER